MCICSWNGRVGTPRLPEDMLRDLSLPSWKRGLLFPTRTCRGSPLKEPCNDSTTDGLDGVAGAAMTGSAARAQQPAGPQQPASVSKPAMVPLEVEVVLSRFQGDKKISSMPYTLSVTANGEPTTLNMGTEVPVRPRRSRQRTRARATGTVAVGYHRPIGTNFVLRASTVSDNLYQIQLNVEDSSVFTPDVRQQAMPMAPDVPAFRSFKGTNSLLLKDGQTRQYTGGDRSRHRRSAKSGCLAESPEKLIACPAFGAVHNQELHGSASAFELQAKLFFERRTLAVYLQLEPIGQRRLHHCRHRCKRLRIDGLPRVDVVAIGTEPGRATANVGAGHAVRVFDEEHEGSAGDDARARSARRDRDRRGYQVVWV